MKQFEIELLARIVVPIAVLALAVTSSPPAAAEGAALPAATPVGAVRLSLDDYLELKAKARRAAEEAEADAEDEAAKVVVEARTTDVVLREAAADGADDETPRALAEVRCEYLLVVRGPLEEPVDLAYGGSLARVEVKRSESPVAPSHAGVQRRRPGAVQFFASQPGAYTVTLHGEVEIRDPLHPTFSWPASSAARDLLRLDLAAAADWTSDAPLLRDETGGGPTGERRRLAFSIPPGKPFSVELQPRADAITRDALVRTTLVTLADLDETGLRLQDAVVYRVLRGAIGSHAVTVPDGRALLRDVFTDEGAQRADSEVRRLELERKRLLGPGAGTAEIGHVLVPYEEVALSEPAAAGTAADRVPIPAPEIDVAPQTRYLVIGSTVAAELVPVPAAAWRRVDLGDLPNAVRSMVSVLEPSGVWQWTAGARSATGDASALDVRRLPPADALDGLVWSRETTTVLTVDGSLVHRDVYQVQVAGSAFPVRLPRRATLWSTTVDGTPVRPLEEAGRVLIPVGFRRNARFEVEVVSVEQQAIEKGRSEIRFEAPRTAVPVLRHEWRLLLPESARYRVDESVLGVASGNAFVASPAISAPGVEGTGIAGRLILEDGSPLPGATVTLSGVGPTRVQVSDESGIFHFLPLDAGDYRLEASLEGFSTIEHRQRVRKGKIASPILQLPVAAVEETITVTSESPQLEPGQFNYRMNQWRDEGRARRKKAESGRVIEDLQGLLTGGVKPLPVSIPESGKVVTLSGALAPEEIWVTVDVRNR